MTVSSLPAPAVIVAEPVTSSQAAEAAPTVQVSVAVREALSVTVTVWLPEVRRARAPVKVWLPLSLAGMKV